jgi:hypothetical protein
MSERSRVSSQWREPPRRYDFTNEQLEPIAGDVGILELACYVGCGFGAMLATVSAMIAWAEPIARFVGSLL